MASVFLSHSSRDRAATDRVLEQLNARARELIEAVGLTEFTDTAAVELPKPRRPSREPTQRLPARLNWLRRRKPS